MKISFFKKPIFNILIYPIIILIVGTIVCGIIIYNTTIKKDTKEQLKENRLIKIETTKVNKDDFEIAIKTEKEERQNADLTNEKKTDGISQDVKNNYDKIMNILLFMKGRIGRIDSIKQDTLLEPMRFIEKIQLTFRTKKDTISLN